MICRVPTAMTIIALRRSTAEAVIGAIARGSVVEAVQEILVDTTHTSRAP
jgi:hypothetical protein